MFWQAILQKLVERDGWTPEDLNCLLPHIGQHFSLITEVNIYGMNMIPNFDKISLFVNCNLFSQHFSLIINL